MVTVSMLRGLKKFVKKMLKKATALAQPSQKILYF